VLDVKGASPASHRNLGVESDLSSSGCGERELSHSSAEADLVFVAEALARKSMQAWSQAFHRAENRQRLPSA